MYRKTQFALASALFSLLFLNLGCVDLPGKLIAPNWDVNLNIPIVNKSYSLSDIIKKQKYISTVPTSANQSIYLIQSDAYTQNIGVSEFLKISSPTSLTNQSIPTSGASNDSTYTLYLPIPDGAELDSAVFTGGSFSFHFDNPLLFPVNLTVTIPGIIKTDGSPFIENLNLAANSNNTQKYNFAGYRYKITTSQIKDNKRDCIQLLLKASSSAPAGSFITMDFYSSDFQFSYVSGYLPSKTLGIQSCTFNIDLGNIQDFRNKIALNNADLELSADYVSSVNNPFNFQINNLSIVGERNDGSIFNLLDKSGNSNFTFLTQNGNLKASFTNSNSNITDFLSFLPDKISIKAEYIMNPGNQKVVSTITDSDSIKISANISTQSYLAITNASITDTMEVNINTDDRDKINNGQNFNLFLNMQNGIPLSSSVQVVFADSQCKPLFALNDPSGSVNFSISAASVDQNGIMKNSTVSKKEVTLNSSEMEMLSKAYYIIYTVSISTSAPNNGTPSEVIIRPEDQITLQANGYLNYKVKPSGL